MTDQMTNEMLKRVDLLIEKAGMGANNAFPWFVRQVYINSVGAWLFFLATLLVFVGTARYCIKETDSDGAIVVLIISGVILIGSVACVVAYGFDWLNPNRWALEAMISMFKVTK